MNDPGAIKRALRLKRARMLVSQGRFQRNGDALPATASVPMTESVAVMPPRGVGGNCFPNNAASMNSADIGRTRGRGAGVAEVICSGGFTEGRQDRLARARCAARDLEVRGSKG